MKAICIDGVKAGQPAQKESPNQNPCVVDEILIEGDEYEVYQSDLYDDCFKVVGKPIFSHYLKKRFALCSDINEMELVNEKLETELLKQE